MKRKKRNIGLLVLGIIWVALTLLLWFGPRQQTSQAERRPLAQMPALSADTFFSGKFFSDFEDFSLDQFPMRDGFRTVKSLFNRYGLMLRDNNHIYVADGYAAKLEFQMSQPSIDYAVNKFQQLKDTYFGDSRVFFAGIPDKGYYLAPMQGYPTMDYTGMFQQLQQRLPWASFVDLTSQLSINNYYKTDTHWRQETLLPVAKVLCAALGVDAPREEDFTARQIDRPFYGVYYGQAALPMQPESLRVMESETLAQCRVYNYETKQYGSVYDMNKLDSPDLYDVYLSGSQALLRIENPNGSADKELIVFRDSYGSSIVPLLVQGYGTITLVDLRFISADMLGEFLEFHGQDVLMLYSTLILNSSMSLK